MKLIFVYNAASGIVNELLDSAHKVLSPKTYSCHLCDITYGVFSENAEWKSFRKASEIEMVFLHKDEFLKQYQSKWLPKYDFPVILSEEQNELNIFMSSEALNLVENSNQLIASIERNL
ncbi:GTPase [Jejudonia soesokkakensis]|uniref:GTPase n=1 Tax=Jejudonia soesokkakensis TaxID=1323432 RepID=A0ABW2MSW1_9FLAO